MIITEHFRTRVAMALQTTASAAQGYLLPTPGTKTVVARAIAKMGNAADLVLSLKYADDATGTNAKAFGYDVPIYVNGVRKSDGKAHTIGDETGDFIVDFVIDPGLIPASKYVGLSYADSNAGNLMCATIVEDVAYKPTAS